MKKKIIAALLVSVMAICAFTGCGKQIEGDGRVQAAMADAGDSQEDEVTPESKQNEEESPEITKEPETGNPEDAANVPDSEENDGSMPESATDSADNAATNEEESGTDSEAGLADNGVGTTEESTETAGAGTEVDGASTGAVVGEEGSVGYTFEDMNETTMYATADGGLNIRDMPASDGKKLGSVAWGTGLTVTGRCNETGWYRVQYDKDGTAITAYASKTYLSATRPTKTSSVNNNANSTTNSNGSTSNGSGGSGTGIWVRENGKDVWVEVSNNSNISVSHSAYSGNGLSKEFVDYLNQQRVANGLSSLPWDDNLASIALTRAVEISTNFDHPSYGTTYAECIQICYSDSLSEWFTNWFNSSGHRAQLMNPLATSAACAFYESNGSWWIVYLNNETSTLANESAEEWEQRKEEGLADGTIVEVGNGAYANADEGWEVVTDQDTIDAVNEKLREMGLIP